VVSAPVQPQTGLVYGQPFRERATAGIELMANDPHSATPLGERTTEAQDETLGPGRGLELRL